MPVIQVEGLCKVYNGAQSPVHALDKISFCAEKGEFLAITGPSGSGKSTLMNILGCLDIPSSGMYYLDNRNVSSLSESNLAKIRNRSVGFVFQSHNLIPSLTALENVELPLIYRNLPYRERRRMAEQALERVGLSQRAKHLPCQLSGGQCQRVAIARAIAADPMLILADEPTGSLDPDAGRQVTDILRSMAENGHTVIMITHDMSIAELTSRVIRIINGKIDGKEQSHGSDKA